MARFNNTRSWIGFYEGRVDGRKATLDIMYSETDTPTVFLITIKDLDRGTSSSDAVPISKFKTHASEAFRLTIGSAERNIKQLLMHTWNSDYISGTSIWNGREFGLSFQRVKK